MRNLFLLFFIICSFANFSFAEVDSSNKEAKEYIDLCKKDLNFFQKILKENSANYANKQDEHFHKWYKKGYEDTLKLIDLIGDADDCYYAMKYYTNGFLRSHIVTRGYIKLPKEQYPGFLTYKKGQDHIVFYKNKSLKYLDLIEEGDKLTHVNDTPIDSYFKEYILPFYAGDNSKITIESASVHVLILDGNRFKPTIRKVTIERDGKSFDLDLKYTELEGSGLAAAKYVIQSDKSEKFKIEAISNGIWIRIPSFFPTILERVYYSGMLAAIKKDLAQEDYIIFDMRGNRGGATKWSHTIIRNLWGDEFIKSLGKAHDYNKTWKRLLRVSPDNFKDFKNTYGQAASDAYLDSLKKGQDFFLKKWNIFEDKENLYTNNDSSKFNAKIYVLTDSFCASTCWSFVNELKQIPGVVHIGAETTIQSLYSYAKQTRSPSECFDFFYPTQIRVEPELNSESSLIPDVVYNGDFKNEAQLIEWALSITEKE